MTLRHVALFDWNEGVSDDIIAEVSAALADLPAAVGSVQAYTYGPNLGLADGNADYGVVADFATQADWEQYRDNPVHRELIETLIAPNISRRTAIQFSF